MTGQPHRVTWFQPDRPVEGATVYVRPDQTPDRELAEAEEWLRDCANDETRALLPGDVDGPAAVLLAEYNRRGTAEQALARLLAVCDDNERHIRANVPHLPPDGGSLSIHAIRKILGARSTPWRSRAWHSKSSTRPSEAT